MLLLRFVNFVAQRNYVGSVQLLFTKSVRTVIAKFKDTEKAEVQHGIGHKPVIPAVVDIKTVC